MSGLAVPPRKFHLYLRHLLAQEGGGGDGDGDGDGDCWNEMAATTAEEVDLGRDAPARERLRELWEGGRLISGRTDFLAIYKSELAERHGHDLGDTNGVGANAEGEGRKRGDFADMLAMYADRFVGILQEEIDEDDASASKARSICRVQEQNVTEAGEMERRLTDGVAGGLVGYLERTYGADPTHELLADSLLARRKDEQFATLQNFLDWFRESFPYYYDRCASCGASAKEDGVDQGRKANKDSEEEERSPSSSDDQAIERAAEELLKEKELLDEEEEENDDGSTFLGYVRPNDDERRGKASRTELYSCHRCGAITRFPRYNLASRVMSNQRGRCGEYSFLMMRFLRALGHEARWVVDWADHVWVEIRLDGRWVHVDPCEAALDKNLLYQEWGKEQTFILAFYPSSTTKKKDSLDTPCIEDVTTAYTSDGISAIQERREESADYVSASIRREVESLQSNLDKVLN